jgi:hypothetical protein
VLEEAIWWDEERAGCAVFKVTPLWYGVLLAGEEGMTNPSTVPGEAKPR